MKVLVTGHNGYIGTVMVPMLIAAGHEVVGCDTDLYERCTFAEGGTIASVPALRKDTRDLTLEEAVAREVYGALIHEDAEMIALHPDDSTLRMRPFYLPMVGENDDGSPIYLSEDWAFSERARRVGYPSYANCAVELVHCGAYRYSLANLFSQPKVARPIRFTRRCRAR